MARYRWVFVGSSSAEEAGDVDFEAVKDCAYKAGTVNNIMLNHQG